MKVKTRIKYYEGYIPPRCRKTRYRECEEYVFLNLKETSFDNLSLAFEVSDCYDYGDYESGKAERKIYAYRGKLWETCNVSDFVCGDLLEKYKTPLDWIMVRNETSSMFCPHFYEDGDHPGRDHILSRAKNDLKQYLLADGVLYHQTKEPMYVINTFGLGHNHGGTGMFVEDTYNSNISRDNYFSALDGENAVSYANVVAARRGDTNNVGKFRAGITVYLPELVKAKPHKQHGTGDSFINQLEKIVESSDSAFEAGLLAMALSFGR